jgi:heme-degrading monooxygenase HmoA
MIARIWHGETSDEKADEYLDYLNRTVVPDYRATPGNRGAFVLRSIEGDRAHFLTISLWDSLESIKRFAGEDYERARYYPEDEKFLLEFEPAVGHYEYFEGESSLVPPRATDRKRRIFREGLRGFSGFTGSK